MMSALRLPWHRILRRVKQLSHGVRPQNRITEAFNSSKNSQFYRDFWVEPAKNAGAIIEPLGYGYQRIIAGNRWTIVNKSSVMIDDYLTLKIMGNKPLTYRLLQELGANVPRHRVVGYDQFEQAENFLRQVSTSVVVKPAMGTGAGQGITTGIKTVHDLRKGLARAAVYDSLIMLEDQLTLNSYRLLYLDGKLIDAVHRKPPSVVGDGMQTIDQLVNHENALRKEESSVRSLFLITKDLEYRQTLKAMNLTPRSIPGAGETVAVKRVVNQNNRFETSVVLKNVSDGIKTICSNLCKSLNVRLAGVDVMANDIGQPWGDTVVINEINTTPGLHHHYLVANRDDKNNVAEQILTYLLAKS